MLIVTTTTRCRQVPLSETIEVARYLANLFSCDIESLPTELLVHSYWKVQPRQFAAATAYRYCLRGRARMFSPQVCQSFNPYYCGRRFGEKTDQRLTVCRQLLSGNVTADYGVPPSVIARIKKYRACLDRARSTVAPRTLLSVYLDVCATNHSGDRRWLLSFVFLKYFCSLMW